MSATNPSLLFTCLSGSRADPSIILVCRKPKFFAHSPVQKTDPLLHTREQFYVRTSPPQPRTFLAASLWYRVSGPYYLQGLKRKLLQILEQAGVFARWFVA